MLAVLRVSGGLLGAGHVPRGDLGDLEVVGLKADGIEGDRGNEGGVHHVEGGDDISQGRQLLFLSLGFEFRVGN